MTAAAFTNLKTAVTFAVSGFINPLIFIFISLSVLYFLWGVRRYINGNISDSDKKEAKQMMLWGVVGLFAIVAMWGLVKVVQNTFNLDLNNSITLPTPSGS